MKHRFEPIPNPRTTIGSYAALEQKVLYQLLLDSGVGTSQKEKFMEPKTAQFWATLSTSIILLDGARRKMRRSIRYAVEWLILTLVISIFPSPPDADAWIVLRIFYWFVLVVMTGRALGSFLSWHELCPKVRGFNGRLDSALPEGVIVNFLAHEKETEGSPYLKLHSKGWEK